MVALYIIVAYLMVGLPAIALLNKDKRIEKKIAEASEKMQDILISAGVFVSLKVATVITLLCLWMFWPSAIYGRIKKNTGRLNAEK